MVFYYIDGLVVPKVDDHSDLPPRTNKYNIARLLSFSLLHSTLYFSNPFFFSLPLTRSSRWQSRSHHQGWIALAPRTAQLRCWHHWTMLLFLPSFAKSWWATWVLPTFLIKSAGKVWGRAFSLPQWLLVRIIRHQPATWDSHQCTGESGLGKSTLINTLFNTTLYPPKEPQSPAADRQKTVAIESIGAGSY